jgi:hypothetical protein
LGLGPTVEDALIWCVAEGRLEAHQVLGAFPHPSSGSGSQVDYFLGRKSLADLKPRDPVRNRIDWMDVARARLQARVAELRIAGIPQPS